MLETARSPGSAPRHRLEMRARSVDAALLAQLAGRPRAGAVHSVFRRVVNLQLDDGMLLSLTACDMDDAPHSAAVQKAGELSGLGFAIGAAARLSVHRIEVAGAAAVSLDGARAWTGRLPAYPDDDTVLQRNLRHASRQLAAAEASARDALPQGSFAAVAANEVSRRGATLIDAMAAGDAGRALLLAHSLLGLGSGLTPAGDDFLLGLFTAASVPGSPAARWVPLALRVAQQAAGSTNLISSTALAQAANGRVRESIATLVGALFAGDLPTLTASLDRVLAIGSSSGADIASGLLAGCRLALLTGGES